METIVFRTQHQLFEGRIEAILFVYSSVSSFSMLVKNLSFVLIQVVPSVAIGFTVYDVMKLYLRVPSRDEAVVEVVTNKRNIQPSSLRS